MTVLQKILLIEAIVRIWYHEKELKEMCCNLVHSMPKRVLMIIKLKGGYIKYYLAKLFFISMLIKLNNEKIVFF